jgi:hypothetical protein
MPGNDHATAADRTLGNQHEGKTIALADPLEESRIASSDTRTGGWPSRDRCDGSAAYESAACRRASRVSLTRRADLVQQNRERCRGTTPSRPGHVTRRHGCRP